MIPRLFSIYGRNSVRYLINLESLSISTIRKVNSLSNDASSGNLKNLSDEEWSKRLTPEAFRVCRQSGTERAHTGQYDSVYASGTYQCTCCGSKLFSSDAKFKSGSGWPSFFTAEKNAVEERRDESHGMIRTEVLCAKCNAHLGHVFADGPKPTGLRYCINSICLNFKPAANSTS